MKKLVSLLIIVITLFCSIQEVNASTNTYQREESNNYGVNKKWEIDEDNIDNVKSTPLVDSKEKIYDFANILTDSEENALYDKVTEFINKTNMELVFVTIDQKYESDSFHDTYATDFYDYNDFGIDNEYYSGVLLIRNAYSDDPYYNIYTFGEAQLYFPKERREKLLDDIYGNFSSKNYVPGYEEVIEKLTNYYDEGIPDEYKDYTIDETGHIQAPYSFPIILAPLISIISTSIVLSVLISKNKMVKKASEADVYLDSKSIGYSKRCDEFITSKTTSCIITSSSNSDSSTGSSGGGYSGGSGRHG